MTEPKSSTPEVEAILANDEFIKKLAAKILDAIQPQPQGTVTHCLQYSMPPDEQAKERKTLWANKLTALGMELEAGLPESAADEYLLSTDELNQVVTEIKTSDAYTEKLSGADLSKAVGKVLADNELMRRKGSMMGEHSPARCTPFSPDAPCIPCSPNNNNLSNGGFFGDCLPCAPNRITACSPNNVGFPGVPNNCPSCSPNSNQPVSPGCFVCSPNQPSNFPGLPNGTCLPCSPNQVAFPGTPIHICPPCSPNSNNPISQGCVACSPNKLSNFIDCIPCAPNSNQPVAPSIQCPVCGPNSSIGEFGCTATGAFGCIPCGPSQLGSPGAPNNHICSSSGPFFEGISSCRAGYDSLGTIPRWDDPRYSDPRYYGGQTITRKF
jgi:hypothetical protein